MTAFLASHTTFRLGGPARVLYVARSLSELKQVLSDSDEPLLILGGGSNVLVSSKGFRGSVVKPALKGIQVLEERADSTCVRVQAGEVWDELVTRAVNQGWSGIESLSGIPGWVGAAPIQNIGAYGQEVGTTIQAVHVLDRLSGEERVFSGQECGFDYRTSRFKSDDAHHWVIHAVDFEFSGKPPSPVQHVELSAKLSSRPLTLSAIRNAVLEIRRSKSMLLDPSDPNHRNAGSFFLNPIVSREGLDHITEVAHTKGWGDVSAFEVGSERFKLSAAWLIEKAGFSKGCGGERARLSTQHCLCLVAHGEASAMDVLNLAKEIHLRVKDVFRVDLSPEPTLVGFDWTWDEFVTSPAIKDA